MSNLTRLEFMRVFGIGLASLLMAGCKSVSKILQATQTPEEERIIVTTCYIMETVVVTEPPQVSLTPRDRLRACWLSFNELAEKTKASATASDENTTSVDFKEKLINDHRAALNALVAAKELEESVADLIQEAYAAAVLHVWRENAPITCYVPMVTNYVPESAEQLVQKSALLNELAIKGELNPNTIAIAQRTIQHDLAFEALTDEEINALYEKLIKESQQYNKEIPGFNQVELEITPDIEKAAQFITDLLTEK